MLTPTDLKLEYLFEHGVYPATDAEYAAWLQDQLIYVRNCIGIYSKDGMLKMRRIDYLEERVKKTLKGIA